MRYLLLAILTFQVHATTKYYIVPDATDQAKQVIVGAGGFTPKDAIVEAPLDKDGEPYPIEAVTIEDVTDEMGQTRKVAKLDKTKAAEQRAKEKKDREDARDAEKSMRQALKVSLRKCLKASPTAAESRECVQVLVREIVKDVEMD